jgi:hypothetical protein
MSEAAVTLVATIAAAFASLGTLSREEMVYRNSWETKDLFESLAAVQDNPDSGFIESHFDSLPTFTPAGFRHVLPYYLRYSIQHPGSEVTGRLLIHLSPDDPDNTFWRERLRAFSSAQKNAICDYLKYMVSELRDPSDQEILARGQVVWECR